MLEIIIRNKVYDVSSYLDEHPGGGDILEQYQHKDATDDFEEIGHSADALAILESFYTRPLTSTHPQYVNYGASVKQQTTKPSCVWNLIVKVYHWFV